MLVDDEPDFLRVMGARIEEWGYDLIKAANGKEALDALKKGRIDVVILDYMLPDMNGIETLKKIRKTDKKVAVIMYTAFPNKDAMKEAEKLGINAFIPKLSAYSDVQSSLKTAIEMVKCE